MAPVVLDWGVHAEACLSTQEVVPATEARVSRPDGESRRPEGAEAASAEGPLARHAGLARSPVGRVRREQRLRRDSEFEAVRRRGKGWSAALLVLRALANGLPCSRFGYVVSRRVGNAVVRNRVRRRIREVVRQAPVREGWDLVFIARSGAAEASYPELKQAVHELLRRGRLLREEQSTEVSQAGRP